MFKFFSVFCIVFCAFPSKYGWHRTLSGIDSPLVLGKKLLTRYRNDIQHISSALQARN